MGTAKRSTDEECQGAQLDRRRAELLRLLALRRVHLLQEYVQQLREGTAPLPLHLPARRGSPPAPAPDPRAPDARRLSSYSAGAMQCQPGKGALLAAPPAPPPFLIHYAARREWKLIAGLAERAAAAAAAAAALLDELDRRGYAGRTIGPHGEALAELMGCLAAFDRDAAPLAARALEPALSQLRRRLQDADAGPAELRAYREALGMMLNAAEYFGTWTAAACRGLKANPKGSKRGALVDWPRERLLCEAGAAALSLEDLAELLVRWGLDADAPDPRKIAAALAREIMTEREFKLYRAAGAKTREEALAMRAERLRMCRPLTRAERLRLDAERNRLGTAASRLRARSAVGT